MNSRLRRAFDVELREARAAFAHADIDVAFRHLERAHILAQRYTGRHAIVHWWMLRAGIARRDLGEVLGQAARIAAALIFSRIWVPVGNTGGAKVSAFAPMALPEDLRVLLEESQNRSLHE